MDLLAGGTWLGFNEYGLVVAVLNRRTGDARDPRKRSRGQLCAEALRQATLAQAREWLESQIPAEYNPCTVFLARPGEGALVVANLSSFWSESMWTAGVHVLTNRPFDDIACPRRARAFRRFEVLSAEVKHGWSPEILPRLQAALADHGDQNHSAPGDPVDEPLCVHVEGYGTRSSSVIAMLADEDGRPRRGSLWVSEGPPCMASFGDPLSLEITELRLDTPRR